MTNKLRRLAKKVYKLQRLKERYKREFTVDVSRYIEIGHWADLVDMARLCIDYDRGKPYDGWSAPAYKVEAYFTEDAAIAIRGLLYLIGYRNFRVFNTSASRIYIEAGKLTSASIMARKILTHQRKRDKLWNKIEKQIQPLIEVLGAEKAYSIAKDLKAGKFNSPLMIDKSLTIEAALNNMGYVAENKKIYFYDKD